MNRRRWRRVLLAALLLPFAALGAERVLDLMFPYPLARLRQLQRSTVVTAADGTWLRVVPTAAGERVLALPWREASPAVRAAVLAAEDARFFDHSGVDFLAVARALASNVVHGRVVSGASTLTMQVVRIVEPRPRTFGSKLIEGFRARQLERLLDKEAIATLWLEQVPMGGTLRGFEAAARFWLGRSARELDLAEAAALTAMVPAPSRRHPGHRPELLRHWRDVVLARLGGEAAAAAMRQPLRLAAHGWPWRLPHLCDAVLAATLPHRPDALVTGADLALSERVRTATAGTDLVPGDGLAIVVLDRLDGTVRVLTGSRDGVAPLDAARCRRSVGSTLKPFLYALAAQQGIVATDSRVYDGPVAFAGWRPANFDRGHAGMLRLGDALATSNNVVAVRCLDQLGAEAFAQLLWRLGLPVPAMGLDLDAALGTMAASPLELARAWQRFVAAPESVGLSARVRDQVLAAMSRLAATPGAGRPGAFAWKSGTSSGRRDAWCVGVAQHHIAVVWTGNLDGRGAADLVGKRSANALLERVVAVL